ncbi:2'-5' RNA ligase family protein [Nocardioides acrostichi]|uniref:2'-5' RNA ligase family protein n=1 Tax=Nocardioides acrostichi TaxID=2784339 RepID=A0A930YD48_9ACTN|nr:2'-5' RNA ligase family protein [Nocardioides acrostichi]MBF4162114.1 2'-5' RNA ligase family protein [Nocardioides acrostichi]
MPKLHSLELVPDDEGQEAVRAQWQALLDAGLPSQAQHRSPSNAPHVSVVEAARLPDEAIDVARVRLAGLLPVTVRVGGVLVLGTGPRVTLARPVGLDDDVQRRALAVRAQVRDRAHGGWLPHLTLARRLPAEDLPRALAVLAKCGPPERVVLAELRRWNPDRGHVTAL